ncbi:MAG: ATP-binding cassette domain-containing protein, partial [Clostridia bacterium]
IYGLIGENGAGKSTFMKMIADLIQPSEGSMELFGNSNPKQERCRLGCAIEAPALYMELTAKQNLEVYCRAYGLTDKSNSSKILNLMNLQNDQNKAVKKFSLGMKQRLAIGIALLGNPDFLILDEPINGLDPTGIQEMRTFLLKLNKELHLTILLSSHILGELAKIATKFGIIKQGQLIDEITEKELTEHCQCCLKFKVSDTTRATVILEKQLHTSNYEVIDNKEIRIFNFIDKPGMVILYFPRMALLCLKAWFQEIRWKIISMKR